MKLYNGNEVILSTRVPSTWKKALVSKVRKEKTTVNFILRTVLERKFRK